MLRVGLALLSRAVGLSRSSNEGAEDRRGLSKATSWKICVNNATTSAPNKLGACSYDGTLNICGERYEVRAPWHLEVWVRRYHATLLETEAEAVGEACDVTEH
jgi:hypothetical protein